MGIFKAVNCATQGVAKDQWKEFFICDSIPSDTIMVRGHKLNKSNNNNGDIDVITDGSIYTVADGQAAIVVAQGKVVATCTEPGEHVYESQYSKGIFSSGNVTNCLKDIARRVSFGGDVPVTERIYYVNTKYIEGGSFNGISVPFRYRDASTGLDMDCTIKCSGTYTFRVSEPGIFYKLVAGNVAGDYKTASLRRVLNAEFSSVLMKATSDLTSEGMRTYEIGSLIPSIEEDIRNACSEKWLELRGIEIASLAFSEFDVTGDDRKLIQGSQRDKMYTDAQMASAAIVSATADSMRMAAQNSGRANVVIGANVGQFNSTTNGSPEWTCSCGNLNKGNFCTNCGAKRP